MMTRATKGIICFVCIMGVLLGMGASLGLALEPTASVPKQVAAAVYVQEWGQILWGLVTNQTGTQPISFGDPIFNPDGSVSQSFTAADGTEALLTFYLDGTARIDLGLPDGTTQVVTQSTPIFDGISVTSIDWTVTSSDGLAVVYTSVVDDLGTPFDMSDDVTQLAGTATVPGGITQTFTVLTAAGETNVQCTQSDGSSFTLRVPLGFPDLILPDFSRAAVGSYADEYGEVQFSLISTLRFPLRWSAFLTDMGGGLGGTFSLRNDFSGNGQLEYAVGDSASLVALVSWTQQGAVEVYSLNGQDIHMGPAGAALDFLQHRWETLAALFAPSPGVSMYLHPSSRMRSFPRLRTLRLFSSRGATRSRFTLPITPRVEIKRALTSSSALPLR